MRAVHRLRRLIAQGFDAASALLADAVLAVLIPSTGGQPRVILGWTHFNALGRPVHKLLVRVDRRRYLVSTTYVPDGFNPEATRTETMVAVASAWGEQLGPWEGPWESEEAALAALAQVPVEIAP